MKKNEEDMLLASPLVGVLSNMMLHIDSLPPNASMQLCRKA